MPRTQQRRRCSSDHRSLALSSCVFGSFACLSWHLADRAGGEIGLATVIIFFTSHSRGTLWYDLLQNCSRKRGCCPGCHSLRFTIYRLGGGCRQCPRSYDELPRGRWPSENMPCKLDEILILHFKSNSSPDGVILPGYYPYPEIL